MILPFTSVHFDRLNINSVEVARAAKAAGVKQFIFMSSQIVFHESQSLRSEVLTSETKENPNGFYGDSKLQAENGIKPLADENFKVCILRPCMIYGPNAKGNFPRLAKLGAKVPVFPAWHNKRSMLYIDNLAELIPFGAFPPSHLGNAQASLALLSVWRRFVLQPINKMFATYYYDPAMSKYDFEYQLVSFEESLKRVAESLGK